MACKKRTIRKMSPPRKRTKSVGGMKFPYPSSSPSHSPSSVKPVVGRLLPRPSPDEAMYHALSPLLDQGIMQRMANLGLGSQASQEYSRMWLKQTLDLNEELVYERLKGETLVQELHDLRFQVSNHP
ncbi:hypothetical protein LIER_23239 [Lithospermum erythrorhizon]|uniref:Uncharacterized protein n=1 Tax=Lithospermum erythrorhizon TaxID=34254 RepID=A0AAV3QXZ1_LITER